MPLTELQRMVITVLRPFRNANSYVAGGAALNQQWPRLSDDMDIFQDLRNQLLNSVDLELQALRDAGFAVEVTTRDEWMVEAIARKYGFETRVQWLDEPETSRRFLPAIVDEELGFRLHQSDVAVNKVLCASRRREARDAVDIASVVLHYAPLGPLIWAALAKDASSPPTVLRGLRGNLFGFSDEAIRAVRMQKGGGITRDRVREILEPALDAAQRYCENVAPVEHLGCLFVTADDLPTEADAAAIAEGSIRALRIRDFAPVPKISDG